ncbi:flavin reductase family protein [Streptomyces sp. MA5143a]|uniref:flavin reductase family protein n=1 Tax=Streptomyces sp. MA5143a TaxID=2083010 RepID=UPI000D1BEDCF|nr:flavin reductase family protein [Streptomyces sp. MA5143a]SPE99906.1 Flavin reductase (NADPH) [Streptomyces sp. MA5143a]
MSHQRYTADLRRLMAGFPTGVSVVTALAPDGTPWGMTCTSLCSVALDPPTLLVCLRAGSPTLRAVLDSGSLSVNLLHERARSASELFGSGAPDRFDQVPWVPAQNEGGPHLIEAAHTIADCTVTAEQTVGDHAVVMAGVTLVTSLRRPIPLLYGMRRYGSWAEDTENGFLSYDFIS